MQRAVERAEADQGLLPAAGEMGLQGEQRECERQGSLEPTGLAKGVGMAGIKEKTRGIPRFGA